MSCTRKVEALGMYVAANADMLTGSESLDIKAHLT